MYIRIGDSLLNMDNVDFVQRDYSTEGEYNINISFSSGGFCNNKLESKEEADELFGLIRLELDTRNVS